MIEVRNLTKYYGSKKALDDVSFQIHPGEVVGLLGPNGAGKTTTLNVITGVIYPNEGQVYINDQPLARNEQELKEKIGYLAEDNPLYYSLLVHESLKIAAELKRMQPSDFLRNLHKVVETVGLSDVLYQPIESLSKGYKQRVGLAQALISNPSVLILDEPTEGLDPNQRQEIRDLIKDLGQEYTVLLSTHVMQEVEAICQRVIILNNGRVAMSGSVAEMTSAHGDSIELELILGGVNTDLVESDLGQEFGGFKRDGEMLVVTVDKAELDSFYRYLSGKTAVDVYIKHLQTRHESMEEVFKRVTS